MSTNISDDCVVLLAYCFIIKPYVQGTLLAQQSYDQGRVRKTKIAC